MAKIKGIWVLNSILTVSEGASGLSQIVNFTSNAIAFDAMILLGDYASSMKYSNIADTYSVYTHSGGWVNEAFRIVDFGTAEQTVSEEWYAAFTANATQAGGDVDPPDEADELWQIWKSTLTGIADAVRSKTGKTNKIPVTSLETEIKSISGGGGATAPILQEKTATENGEYLPDRGYDGFSKFTVDVKGSGGGGIAISAKTQKCEIRYVSSQMGAITITATVSVA